jgi:glycosyltransferase involved in cell wall biosynthesis
MATKLLYITNGITGSGGLERVLSIKATWLLEYYNYEVHILTLNEFGISPFYHFSNKIQFHTIEVRKKIPQYIRDYIIGLRRKVKEIKPDIIAVCDDGLKGFFVPQIIRKKIPAIYERHASIIFNTSNGIKGKLMKYLMKSQVMQFDKFVVLTEANCKEWNKKNVMTIPNPLGFYSEKSSSLTNKKIIVVGSHSYNKGYDLLLRAWKIVSDKHSDWGLHIYGKIDADETFIKMANAMLLDKNIHFHSPTNEIQAAYLESSIMICSSRTEGFGNVLVEAMACGLPCVSFDCPSGPADIICNKEDGFLVPNGNVTELAEKIIYLIENEDIRQKMGRAAKKNVKRFLPEKIIVQWDKLFTQLLSINN